MSQANIRSAISSERALLEALQWRASLHNPNDRDALLANPDAIELPLQQIIDGGVFVIEQAGQIKGFAAILPRPDGNAELDALFVDPAYWRHGLGRALLEHCANAAKMAGASSLHVIGNPHAEHFYTACEFQLTGTTHTRFGDGLLMKRSLR